MWCFSKGLCFDDLLNPIKMQLVNMSVCAGPAVYIEMPFNRAIAVGAAGCEPRLVPHQSFYWKAFEYQTEPQT